MCVKIIIFSVGNFPILLYKYKQIYLAIFKLTLFFFFFYV